MISDGTADGAVAAACIVAAAYTVDSAARDSHTPVATRGTLAGRPLSASDGSVVPPRTAGLPG
ncbi:hypothetical protein ACFQFH_07675 [Halobaculum halobium]|uniref:hypothetical protein n=1 Tax=Halobaculum halobium TaxID=3032281 RepID=UPI003606866C